MCSSNTNIRMSNQDIKKNMDMVTKTQRPMERLMLGIGPTENKRNSRIRRKPKVEDVNQEVAG